MNTNSIFSSRAPIDRVNIKLPQTNTYAHIVSSSRDRSDAPWRTAVTSVYELQGDSQPIHNVVIPIAVNSDRYWRMQARAAGGIGRGAPVLQVAWIPHEITFVARGRSLAMPARYPRPHRYRVRFRIQRHKFASATPQQFRSKNWVARIVS